MAYDMIIANTFFKKREEHLVTFKSGTAKTQIDYFLTRKGDRKECKDCKVIPGESLTTQHRLLVLDVHLKGIKMRTKVLNNPRIKWWALKGEMKLAFREKMFKHDSWNTMEDANDMWEGMAKQIRELGRQVVGESKGQASFHKESWWWQNEVQDKVKAKRACYKELYKCRNDENKEKYKTARKEAKEAVSKARNVAYEDLYRRLDTKDGEKDIYRLAKARDRKTKDLSNVKCIKDECQKVLVEDEAIRRRWMSYFQ